MIYSLLLEMKGKTMENTITIFLTYVTLVYPLNSIIKSVKNEKQKSFLFTFLTLGME